MTGGHNEPGMVRFYWVRMWLSQVNSPQTWKGKLSHRFHMLCLDYLTDPGLDSDEMKLFKVKTRIQTQSFQSGQVINWAQTKTRFWDFILLSRCFESDSGFSIDDGPRFRFLLKIKSLFLYPWQTYVFKTPSFDRMQQRWQNGKWWWCSFHAFKFQK